jgi:hypothetical protein
LPQQVPKVNVDFHPVWTLGGKGLVYAGVAANNLFASVSVTTTSASLTFGSPMTFASPVQDRVSSERRDFDILPDGRFIGVVPIDQDESRTPIGLEMHLVLNWAEELKTRVPIK